MNDEIQPDDDEPATGVEITPDLLAGAGGYTIESTEYEPVSEGCRRCSECRNSEHHWMENGEFGDTSPFSHVCKHCRAVGGECDECGGDGRDNEYHGQMCAECGGEGVIVGQESEFPFPLRNVEITPDGDVRLWEWQS